jgi:hypothetical protein
MGGKDKPQVRVQAVPEASASGRRPLKLWSVDEVVACLKTNNLGRHEALFRENEIDGPVFAVASLDDLVELGVAKLQAKALLSLRDELL